MCLVLVYAGGWGVRLYDSLHQSILVALGNEESAGLAMEIIMRDHPALSSLWDASTCRWCRSILVDAARVQYCDDCQQANADAERRSDGSRATQVG